MFIYCDVFLLFAKQHALCSFLCVFKSQISFRAQSDVFLLHEASLATAVHNYFLLLKTVGFHPTPCKPLQYFASQSHLWWVGHLPDYPMKKAWPKTLYEIKLRLISKIICCCKGRINKKAFILLPLSKGRKLYNLPRFHPRWLLLVCISPLLWKNCSKVPFSVSDCYLTPTDNSLKILRRYSSFSSQRFMNLWSMIPLLSRLVKAKKCTEFRTFSTTHVQFSTKDEQDFSYCSKKSRLFKRTSICTSI